MGNAFQKSQNSLKKMNNISSQQKTKNMKFRKILFQIFLILFMIIILYILYFNFDGQREIDKGLLLKNEIVKIDQHDLLNHKIILMWNKFFGEYVVPESIGNASLFSETNCGEKHPKCLVTSNHNLEEYSQAYILHDRDISSFFLPANCDKNSTRPCILLNMEPPGNTYQLSAKVHYHLTANFRRDSDIVLSYGYTEKFDKSIPSLFRFNEDKYKQKKFAAAWMVSNCNTRNYREYYVRELQRYIHVDIFGKCGTLECPKYPYHDCLGNIEKKYYFYLSFENSFNFDYASEKIFSVLDYNIIPIVYGIANYSELLPPNSYIDATGVEPFDLSIKMKSLMNNNYDKYSEYLRWKTDYRVYINNSLHDLSCKVCDLITTNNGTKYVTKSGTVFNDWYFSSDSGFFTDEVHTNIPTLVSICKYTYLDSLRVVLGLFTLFIVFILLRICKNKRRMNHSGRTFVAKI